VAGPSLGIVVLIRSTCDDSSIPFSGTWVQGEVNYTQDVGSLRSAPVREEWERIHSSAA
jgi:hypothetical protein